MSTTDLVPADVRAGWVAAGYCPGLDLLSLYERQLTTRADKVAVVDDAGSVTYAELAAEASAIAGYLHQIGIGKGDVVAVQFPNNHQACAADLAVAAVGAICLPYPILYRHREARSLLARSGAAALLCARRFRDFDHAAMVNELRPELPALRHVAVLGEPYPGFDHLDAIVGDAEAARRRPAVELGPNDPVRIVVTSGTEAEPKMVLYSHDGVGGGIANVLTALRPDDDTLFLLLPPLSSGFGALGTFGALARHGMTMVVTAAFDPTAAFKLIERERVTHVLAVPTMLNMLLAAGSGDTDLSSLQVVGSFGAAMPESRVWDTLRTFGTPFVNGYGCSDGAICMTGWDDPPERIAQTVGRPSPSISNVRVVGGEICARGPMSPLRYFNSPELDERYRFDGGWVRTGDLGRIDDDGYLRVTGRKKDILVRGGFNISPAETEAALLGHEAILEAACVGMPDERLGERMCAFVVLREGADPPDLVELQELLRAQGLAVIKLPERLEVIDEMPLNPTGKILKRVLRARVEQLLAVESAR